MKLIIAEKKIAAERIARILFGRNVRMKKIEGHPVWVSGEWIVFPLSGHIVDVDFPEEFNDWRRIEPIKLLNIPLRIVYRDKRIVKALKKIAKKVDEVIIATDYDREGEAIGFEALEIIRKVNPRVKCKRAIFSAITEKDIKKAFANLKDPDKDLADAAFLRRDLDFLWGCILTRFLSLTGRRLKRKRIYSAGRVQTPTLALVVRRELERMNFRPKIYYKIRVKLENGIEVTSDASFQSKDECKLPKKLKVVRVTKTIEYIHPPPPYNTTAFLADASKYLGIGAEKALLIAEFLYMKGYISYPRTDNTVFPPTIDLRSIVQMLSEIPQYRKFCRRILAVGEVKAKRGRIKSKDHPPLHPTGILKGDGKSWAIYDLIARRFLASLMPPAKVLVQKVVLRDENGVTYTYTGKKIIDMSWLEAFYWKKVEQSPIIDVSGEIKVIDAKIEKRKTSPPPRYSEAELLKEMEKLGLGTKATRHEILAKLRARRYIKGRRTIQPTQEAFNVIRVLEKYVPEITTPDLTARLEKEMEAVSLGKKRKEEVFREGLLWLKKILQKMYMHRKEIEKELRVE